MGIIQIVIPKQSVLLEQPMPRIKEALSANDFKAKADVPIQIYQNYGVVCYKINVHDFASRHRNDLELFEGLMIFGRDVSKIPCFRESFLYGIGTGIGVGLATFLKTSKPMFSQHVGVGMFSLSTMVYWSYCRWCWSQQRFDAQLLQDALKDKIVYEGTAVERELEQKGILKSA